MIANAIQSELLKGLCSIHTFVTIKSSSSFAEMDQFMLEPVPYCCSSSCLECYANQLGTGHSHVVSSADVSAR